MEEKYKKFLDELQESGNVNMMAGASELALQFGLDREEAKKVLFEWIDEKRKR